MMMFKIAMLGGGSRDVAGEVYGEWAAHPNPDGVLWRVSHVPTGVSLAQLADELTEADAMVIARLLAERVPSLGRYALAKVSPSQSEFDADDMRIIEATVAETISP